MLFMYCRPRKSYENDTDSSSEPEKLEEDHSLERIVKKRTTTYGETEYLVKWKGFSHAYNTWETKETINRPLIVKDFKEKSILIEKKKPKCGSKHTMSKPSIVISTEDSTGAGPSKDCREITPTPTKNLENPDIINHKQSHVLEKNENIKFGEPEKITNVFLSDGIQMFKLKRKGIKKVEIISFDKARYLYPQIVIAFYESITNWK